MKLDVASGLLTDVVYIPSPHCSLRTATIELLVIHGISLPSRRFGGSAVIQLFTGCLDWRTHPDFAALKGLQVSAHVFIRRDGQIIQCVPFTFKAWHAGVSVFRGRTHCNDFSIGIELEGCDDIPYERAQYQSLGLVTKKLMQAYPRITLDRIVGHADIAPGRKTDPGVAFDWSCYYCVLAKLPA